MKAITLWQPFASLIACGAKTIETRSWGTSYRGPLAIHAAKKWDEDIVEDCEAAMEILRNANFRVPSGHHWRAGKWLFRETLGKFLAVSVLIDCRPMREAPNAFDRRFGTFGPGRYGWLLERVRPLQEPVACRGAQGLWDVPADVAKMLES